MRLRSKSYTVLVPFYRGAVVFRRNGKDKKETETRFSSPFIEERLYFEEVGKYIPELELVLVPFYRGAVVFEHSGVIYSIGVRFSSPFIEERLYFI